MKIIGFDIATRSGWAIVEEDPIRVVQTGAILIDKGQGRARQLEHFRQDVFAVLREQHVKAIVFEQVPVAHSRNAATIANQHELYGAFMIACYNYNPDIPIIAVSPNIWHRDCLGIVSNTARLKAAALLQLQMRTGFATSDMDIGDAGMIAIWGLGALRLRRKKGG